MPRFATEQVPKIAVQQMRICFDLVPQALWQVRALTSAIPHRAYAYAGGVWITFLLKGTTLP